MLAEKDERLLHSAVQADPSRLNPSYSLGPSEYYDQQAFSRRRRSMQIRIIKALPAPLMDGFDVKDCRNTPVVIVTGITS